jgi:hypothetical protein
VKSLPGWDGGVDRVIVTTLPHPANGRADGEVWRLVSFIGIHLGGQSTGDRRQRTDLNK